MTFKSLGVVDNLTIEKFDRLVDKYHSTTNQKALDTIAYDICEEISELREVLTRLDTKYIAMEEHGRLAADMSQKKGGEARKLQRQVNELAFENGDLKRRLKLKEKVHR